MRTKVLLGAALLAASLASSMADTSNVYSLNVVGYVNQTVQSNHWYLFGNPLAAAASDSGTVLTNLVSANPTYGADWGNADGSKSSIVYCYNQPGGLTGGYGSPDVWYYDPTENFVGWAEGGNVDLTPGNGFWFYSTANGTVTFVGNVVTSNKWTIVPGWNLVSSAYPAALSLNTLGLLGSGPVSPPGNALSGDFIYRWNLNQFGYTNGYDAGITYYNDAADGFVGWASGDNNDLSGPEGPALNPGEGIWYQSWKSTGTNNWTATFTIQ